MKKIVEVDVVFENCEVKTIKGEDIIELSLMGLSKKIHHISGGLSEFNTFKSMTLSLSSSVNYIFSRFEARDITQIIFKYSDGNSKHYFVPYEDEQEGVLGSPNKYMTCSYVGENQSELTVTINS